MIKSTQLECLIEKLKAAIEVVFPKMVKAQMREHGDDLAMIGLATSGGLEYLSLIQALYSTLKRDSEHGCPSILNALRVYSGAPDVGMKKVDRIMGELYDLRDEPGFYQAVYDGIIAGMRNAEANKIVGSESANASTIVAFIIAGGDWGTKSMISTLNSPELAERLIPTASFIRDGTLREIGKKSTWANTWSAYFVSQGSNRVLFTSQRDIYQIELATEKISHVARSQCRSGFGKTSISADKKTMVSVSYYELEYWSLEPSVESLWTAEVGFQTTAVSAAPSGMHAVIGCFNGPALIWDLTKNEEVFRLTHSNDRSAVMACSWSKDGKTIATSGRDLTLRLWDGQSFVLLDEVQYGGDVIHFVPRKDLIAVASGFSQSELPPLRFWDYANKVWKPFEPGVAGRRFDRIAISDNGERFVAGSSLFDAEGSEIASVDVGINDATFLDDGTVLISWAALGEPGGPIAVWNF